MLVAGSIVAIPDYQGFKARTEKAFELGVAAVDVLLSRFIFTPSNDRPSGVEGLGADTVHYCIDAVGFTLTPSPSPTGRWVALSLSKGRGEGPLCSYKGPKGWRLVKPVALCHVPVGSGLYYFADAL